MSEQASTSTSSGYEVYLVCSRCGAKVFWLKSLKQPDFICMQCIKSQLDLEP